MFVTGSSNMRETSLPARVAIAAVSFALLLCTISPLSAQTFQVKSVQKIADNTGGFGVTLTNSDNFGVSVVAIGDLDNDGVEDLAVGAHNDDTGGAGRGALYVLLMNSNGTVKSHQKIADNTGGFGVTLTNSDFFGVSVAALGDLDDDGVKDLAVGAFFDDTGGTGRGAVYVLFMNTNGTVKSHQKIADNTGGFGVTLTDSDAFGAAVVGLGDLDNDGVEDLAIGAKSDDTGGTDRGAVYVLFMNTNGTVKSSQKIADNTGGFGVTLADSDFFGGRLAALGDFDGDGIEDLASGAQNDDTGGTDRGAFYVLLLNSDGTVKSHQKIADNTGGFNVTLTDSDVFGGSSVTNLGDLDGDGVADLAAGAMLDDTGGTDRGALYLLLMNSNSTVKSNFKIADNTGGFDFALTNTARFGISTVGLGDLDGDGVGDLAIGADKDDTGGMDRGALWVVFLTKVPTITAISPKTGKVGDSVTITGTEFDATAANNKVFFGATKATVTAASTTSLTVTVPTGATFGPLRVIVNNRTAESDDSFLPTFASEFPTIDASTFGAKVDFTTAAGPLMSIPADIDGDGKTDLVVVNQTASSFSVFRNTSTTGTIDGSTYAAKVDFTTGTTPAGLAIADYDRNGVVDVAVTNSATDNVSVFRNTSTVGAISFAAKVDYATGTQPNIMIGSDMDEDGKVDMVTANNVSGDISVFRNTSTSGAIDASSFAAKVDFTAGTQPREVAVGDIDGDDQPDIVVGNASTNNISVFRNTSVPGGITTSSFAAKVDFAALIQPEGLEIVDLDGDGKDDVALANFSSSMISVFRNTSVTGAVTFAARIDYTSGVQPQDIAIGDIDGDGKPDIAAGNANFGAGVTVSVLRNTSTSGVIDANSFAAKVDFTTPLNPVQSMITDVDGDGKPELVSANGGATSISVFQNLTPTTPAPTITSVSPLLGKIGDTITITGTHFDATTTNNTVYIGGIKATVVTASTTTLTVTMPAGATVGPVRVTVKERTAVSNKILGAHLFGGRSDDHSRRFGRSRRLHGRHRTNRCHCSRRALQLYL